MWDFGTITDAGDRARLLAEIGNTIWDARADLDDDGDVDATDSSAYNAKKTVFASSPTVSQAFSDVDNPFMFQGRPHFAIDTAASATTGKLMLNDHRARFADPVIGRWVTRDPLFYGSDPLLSWHARAGYTLQSKPKSHEVTRLVLEKHAMHARPGVAFHQLNAILGHPESRALYEANHSNSLAYNDPSGMGGEDCCDGEVIEEIVSVRNEFYCQPPAGHSFVCIYGVTGYNCYGFPASYPTPVTACSQEKPVCMVCTGQMQTLGGSTPCSSVNNVDRELCIIECLNEYDINNKWQPWNNCISAVNACLSKCCMMKCQ